MGYQKSEPVLLLIVSTTCNLHCKTLLNNWETIKNNFKAIYPNLRFVEIYTQSHFSKDPPGLARFIKWFPMLFLIPGKVWDTQIFSDDACLIGINGKFSKEITNLGSIQILNVIWKQYENNYFPNVTNKYNTQVIENYSIWLRDSLNNPEFKAI